MRKAASFLLFFAIVFMIFHDQMANANSTETSSYKSVDLSSSQTAVVHMHEQIHAYTISFEKLTLPRIEYFENSEFFATNIQYNFITFNLPYRPPAII